MEIWHTVGILLCVCVVRLDLTTCHSRGWCQGFAPAEFHPGCSHKIIILYPKAAGILRIIPSYCISLQGCRWEQKQIYVIGTSTLEVPLLQLTIWLSAYDTHTNFSVKMWPTGSETGLFDSGTREIIRSLQLPKFVHDSSAGPRCQPVPERKL